MDIGSIIGVILVVGVCVGSIAVAPGAKFSAFIDYPSIMCVIGGALAASLVCLPLKSILKLPTIVAKVFLTQSPDVAKIIAEIVSLADTARRDGVLAMEARLEAIQNRFVRLGIELAVDGTRPEVLEDIMQTEMNAMAARHKEGKAVMDQLGRFAPAFGMIGTLLGLIIMLGNMSDPTSIGSGMAVALLTTLYGAVLSNGVTLPFADKLAVNSKQELVSMEVILRGILAIQAGENPRVIEQKLSMFLPPGERGKVNSK